MSHNVNIDNVRIKSFEMLNAAVNELRREGLNATLTKGGNIRGWYGETERCDYVLSMHDCRYDVGFNVQKDGTLVPRVENMAYDVLGSIGAADGDKTLDGKACDRYSPGAIIGRLTQRINVITAEIEAAQNGVSTRREAREGGILAVVAEFA